MGSFATSNRLMFQPCASPGQARAGRTEMSLQTDYLWSGRVVRLEPFVLSLSKHS